MREVKQLAQVYDVAGNVMNPTNLGSRVHALNYWDKPCFLKLTLDI